jgi:hypothetical protein
MYIKPYFFLRLGHFFGYGYPEFDMNSDEKPNEWETDFEKLPI